MAIVNRVAWSSLLLVLVLVLPVRAATLQVTALDDAGPGSLRSAISSAVSGDRIEFAAGLTGTIPVSSLMVIDKDLSIDGGGRITLDAQGVTRVFNLTSGRSVLLSGLKFQNGRADDGGAIWSQANLQIVDCEFDDNVATARAGALFVGAGSYSIRGSRFQGSFAPNEGGALVDFSTAPSQIVDSEFSGNSTFISGGAIRQVSGQRLTIQHSRFLANQGVSSASTVGGAISSQSSILIIEDSRFSGNKATFGAALYLTNQGAPARLFLSRSTLSSNSAENAGGGLFAFGAEATIVNSTLADNLAQQGGAGLAMQNNSNGSATVLLQNATVAYNRSGTNGAGIAVYSGNLSLRASLLAANLAPTNPDLAGNLVSLGNNLVQTRGTSSGYVASDLANGTAPFITSLQPNGGPTSSILPVAGSPLINAVSSANCALVTEDQRGYPRPSTGCDIGAIEAGAVPAADPVFADAFE